MMNIAEFQRIQTRRCFLHNCVGGLGTIALASLLQSEGRTARAATSAVNLLAPKPPHFTPKAKNVIFLFMAGAPSQIDLFDPKPELKKWHGRPLPLSVTKDLKLAFIKPTSLTWASPRTFQPSGQCGTQISDWLPHMQTVMDEVCLVRSMHTEAFNHHPGQALLMSGTTMFGHPSMGAWVAYGLGSESRNLPGFVVLSSGRGTSAASNNWSCGFLSSTYQGIPLRSQGEPILYLNNPRGVNRQLQRLGVEAVGDLNRQRYRQTGDREIASRIQSYELAFQMQAAAPQLIDFSGETKQTLTMYGVEKEPTRSFATNCLLARRMVERGVRFVLASHATWDDHERLNEKLKKNCDIIDQPIAALLQDLKQRGLLDSTLVIWGGEFGRTPMAEVRRPEEADNAGRDHHNNGFSMWLAGGGIKGGQVIGRTDPFGLSIVEDPIHLHDLQATVLHCLGLDHEQLTYHHLGRDFRLTDVAGNVIEKML